MSVIRPRHRLAFVMALSLIITLLAAMIPVPHAAAQQAEAQQASPYFIDVRIPGKGIVTDVPNFHLCKDRTYQITVTTRQQTLYGPLVPNTLISVQGASRGTLSPSSIMTGGDRPYDAARFSYRASETGTETLRFTSQIGDASAAQHTDRTVSFEVEDCTPTVQLIWRGNGFVSAGPTATAQYFAVMDPVKLDPAGENQFHGSGELVYQNLMSQSADCSATGFAVPAPTDISARVVDDRWYDFTFTFTPSAISINIDCWGTMNYTFDMFMMTAFSKAIAPIEGGTVKVPIDHYPDPILHVWGTMYVIVTHAR
jgi:hypothetical protein